MSGRSLLLVLDIITGHRLTVADLLVLLSIEKGGHVGNELLVLMLGAGIVAVDADQIVTVTKRGQWLRQSLPGIADRIAGLEVA